VVLLQLSWRRGSKGSRSQGVKGLFSKDFIRIFNNLLISVYLMLFENFSFILYLKRVSRIYATALNLCNALGVLSTVSMEHSKP